MSTPFTSEQTLDAGPLHRSIVIVDLEGSTKRNNPAKGELRRSLYQLVEQAFRIAGIGPENLERLTDRGDGVLILIRPHDEVPKTVVLGRLIPVLTALLAEHNASVTQPQLQLRLRAVVHAGEVHDDGRGFYGDDLDVACRLLDSPTLKKALKEAAASPLVLAVSEEIFNGIVQQGYLAGGSYQPLLRVRVGNRQRRGWVHIPVPVDSDRSTAICHPMGQLLPMSLAIASVNSDSQDPMVNAGWANVNGREGPRRGRG
jgi:hypothetical protein